MTIQTDRRAFLAAGSIATLTALAGCTGQSETESQSAELPSYTEMLGVQLYTVRELFERDARGTLEALAEIGVKDCETAGLFDHKAADIRAIMTDLGLVSRSAHIRLPELQDGIGPSLEDAEILGQSILYLGWIPEDERTADRYRALADLLNERGAEAKAAGKMIGYHNHEFEFVEQEGTTGYNILLERTDPELVTMEIDFFWVAEAGVDPLDLFKRAPGRFTSCHIKDRSSGGDMVSVGDGVIDFKTLLPLAEEAGIERFYVEHDNPEDALASVGRSFAHLTA
ncbi:MAG: sugar phosphate isomerase/epimerase [Erythrobacter sp.]|nr:sugar phosphate isomerase/epimerase [Erythrobacter sp.]